MTLTAEGHGAVATALVSALRSAGCDLVFGVPGGGSNLDVIGAAEAAGCRFILTHTETAAAIMAGVAAELTGHPSACVVTRGPGAASAVNGIAQARLDRQPVVLISDCVTHHERQRVSHQRLDHQALLGSVTKASVRVGPTDQGLAAQMVALACEGRPGPVHLDLDPTATPPAGADRLAPPAGSANSPQPVPTASDRHHGGETAGTATAGTATAGTAAVRRAIGSAHRPVIVAGVGAVALPAERRARLRRALAHFLEGSGTPLLTTYKARGITDDRGPFAAGVATGATIEAPLLETADLIVGLGLDPVELIPAPWPYAAPVVLLGSWRVDDSSYFDDRVTAEVVGDLGTMLDDLVPYADTAWDGTEAQQHRQRAIDEIQAARPARPTGLSPQDVVSIARELAPEGTVATIDSGAHMLAAVVLWEVAHPGELLISSGLATMGFALPAAVASALVNPDRRVVCFCGDGGLGMTLAELETLARLQLPVVVVVFNDSTLSLIAAKQRSDGHGGNRAVRYASTDFAAIAAGCGLRVERVADLEAYRRALPKVLSHPGPALVDVAVDPSGYAAMLDAIRGDRSRTPG